MRRTALKPSPPHKIPSYVRTLLLQRCQGRCDFCGQQLNQTDAHHRLQRSLGGKDFLSNLVALHRRCHSLVHDHIADSTTAGWIVASHCEPRDYPVQLFDGAALLDDLGGVHRL